ncbi:hypothetical protein HpSP79_09600 [Helicobacter pylori]
MQQRIQIPRNGIELAGVLSTPENFDETKQYPAIMVVHPGGVKEQAAGLYVGKLTEADFVAVAYDASHQDESGGEPRFLESPSVRVADNAARIDKRIKALANNPTRHIRRNPSLGAWLPPKKNWYALKAQPTFLYMIKTQTKQ